MEGLLEVVVGGVGEAAAARAAGVGDEDVDAAEGFLRLRDEVRRAGRGADVGDDAGGVTTVGGDRGDGVEQHVLPPPAQGDRDAFGGQRPGRPQPEPG